MKLLAYCGHPKAINRVGEQGILHDDELYVWLGGLKRFGAETTLHAALAIVNEALSHLNDAPWIIESAGPLLRASEAWAASPTLSNAQRALEAAKKTEEFASRADKLSTLVGDWWSYEVIEMCGLIPTAIAMHAGLLAPTREMPGPPVEDLVDVCRYFSAHPNRRDRSDARIRHLTVEAIIAWVLGP